MKMSQLAASTWLEDGIDNYLVHEMKVTVRSRMTAYLVKSFVRIVAGFVQDSRAQALA